MRCGETLLEPHIVGGSMAMFSAEFVSALLAIITIDLILAGDNAIVIALVARQLPKDLQRTTIVVGTIGAVAVRVLMTLAIVWLLNVPGLLLAGGILLIGIACRLPGPERNKHNLGHFSADTGLWKAVRTIIIADAIMGMDNMLGVAGAAQGDFLLVALGLLISIPIMIAGSTLILKWVERYPVIVYFGAAVLAWTAAKMISREPMLNNIFQNEAMVWALYCLSVGTVLASGLSRRTALKKTPEREKSGSHSR
jgi:YjbE family integral membrane protein